MADAENLSKKKSGMSNLSYELFIDTGGTFTDCIAEDSAGGVHRRKVLSSSALRGEIVEWRNARELRVKESWELTRDIVRDYRFQLLQHEHGEITVESFAPESGMLVVSDDLPTELVGRKLSFEIVSPEEAPLLGARLITQTALDEQLPPLQMKLASTKGTNALLEKKGAEIVFFVTKGFKDILHIGDQQRPDIFALNVVKPPPLQQHVVEVDERIDARGEVLIPLSCGELKKKSGS